MFFDWFYYNSVIHGALLVSPEKKRAMGKSVLYVATDLRGRADCLMTMEFYVES